MTSWARHNDDVYHGPMGSWVPWTFANFLPIPGILPDPAALAMIVDWSSDGNGASSFKSDVESAAGVSIPALNDLIGALSNAQKIYHTFTLFDVPSTVSSVVTANDPLATYNPASPANLAYLALFTNRFLSFSTHQSTADLSRFADVTHRSLDSFSGLDSHGTGLQRGGPVPINGLFNSSYHWDIPFPDLGGTYSLSGIHSGGTELTADFKSWNAIDTSSMLGSQVWWSFDLGCFCMVSSVNFIPPIPLAWNGATAGPNGASFSSLSGGNYFHGWNSYGTSMLINLLPTTIQLAGSSGTSLSSNNPSQQTTPTSQADWNNCANHFIGLFLDFLRNQICGPDPGASMTVTGTGPGNVGTFSGLQPYQELSNLATDHTSRMQNIDSTVSGSNLPVVVIEVEKTASNILTTANMPNGGQGAGAIGTLALPDRQAGNVMRVVAGAEVNFARPVSRSDGKLEWPNLFNPYWQARLRDTRPQAIISAALQ
jgi:hypothetical protein